MVDQVLITTLQHKKVNNIVCQQNESLLQENLSKISLNSFI